MAWNTLKYACGHTEDVQLYGKLTERERTVARAENHDCPACRAAKAKANDAESGLPALRGSDKQIAWASQIRAETMATKSAFTATMDMYQAKLDAGDYPADTPAEKVEAARAEIARNRILADRLDAIDKASWWIDHRGNSYKLLIGVLAKEIA
jgi:hypothetical protein